MHYVFVYGTLKRGYWNNRLLETGDFIGEAVTKPLYRMYDLGQFPGLVADAEGVAIKGEIYRIDDETLARLDDLEGVPHFRPGSGAGFYRRERAALEAFDKPTWVYLFNRETKGLNDCGTVWPPATRCKVRPATPSVFED